MKNTRLAALQMNSTDSVESNLREAKKLIEQAVDDGSELLLLPENFAFMGRHESSKLAVAEPDGKGPIQDFLADIAQHHKIWLVGGTVPIEASKEKVYPACCAYGPSGERVARYDKIHLFDVFVGSDDEEQEYRESDSFQAGKEPVSFATPFGQVALSVCYDLRFPELYRQLQANGGMDILVMPAAFTEATGRAHWQVLLQARAIENQCYVLAAGQSGLHPNGRTTWGHSMVVGPWGDVLAAEPEAQSAVVAEFDASYLLDIRRRFPALRHRVIK